MVRDEVFVEQFHVGEYQEDAVVLRCDKFPGIGGVSDERDVARVFHVIGSLWTDLRAGVCCICSGFCRPTTQITGERRTAPGERTEPGRESS